MRIAAIIAASGLGSRLGAAEKKQYLLLQGAPVLAWSIETFLKHPDVYQIVVVIPPGEIVKVRKILKPHCPLDRLIIVEGGPRRQDSVLNGLQQVNRDFELVCIHDGARPLVTRSLVDKVINAALQHGAAVPVLPVTDTIKEVTNGGFIKSTISRDNMRLAQTPQAFRLELIREAYRKAELWGIVATDDAYLLELLGHHVYTVPGDPENLKITCPSDLPVAAALLKGDR